MKPIRILNQDCSIAVALYPGGAVALQTWSNEGPMARLTINVPGSKIPHNHVLIKDYGENVGMAKLLVDQGFTTETSRKDGFVLMEVVDPDLKAAIIAKVPAWDRDSGIVRDKLVKGEQESEKKVLSEPQI